MVFSSLPYVLLLALTVAALFLLRSNAGKKGVLLAVSYVFYFYSLQKFPPYNLPKPFLLLLQAALTLGLLAALTVVTHLCCRAMLRTEDAKQKRNWLMASLVASLGTLAVFKYTDFFIGSVNGLFNAHLGLFEFILPVGISFIVFETVSYAVDVYRGDTDVAESFWDFALLVAFFPHLIAGPILKPKQFLPQTRLPIRVTGAGINAGAQQFLVGLIKKTLVANRVAPVVDDVFAHPSAFATPTVWLGVVAYAIQIYGDFSGYTDMAIGSARCLGFDLPPNFDLPYLSRNITEFWRRWHISLSTWLRDYLYIPLGGNRKGRLRQYANLFVVMLLGGLWHGASWNFVVWGGLHGVGLAGHKLWTDRGPKINVPRALNVLATFLFVILLWVPFRAKNWPNAGEVISRLFVPAERTAVWWPSALLLAIPLLVVADGLAVRIRQGRLLDLTRFRDQFAVAFLLLALLYLAPRESAPFIYFQF